MYLYYKKGITVISLVITIIVMLILAGVTINIVISGGLFKQAQNAAVETRGATLQEARDLWITEQTTAKYVGGQVEDLSTLVGELQSQGLLTAEEANRILNVDGKVEIGSRSGDKAIVFKELTIADFFDETGTDSGKLKIGDYVAYFPDNKSYVVSSQYSGTSANPTIYTDSTLNWRVLDKIGDTVLLISDKPNNSTLTLYGQNGYNNAVYLLNDLCNTLYSKSGIGTARSINIEDIQNNMNLSVWNYNSYNKYNTTFSPNASYRNYPLMLAHEKKQKIDGVKEGTLGLSEQTEPIIGATNAGSNWVLTATFWQNNMVDNNFNNSKYYELFMNNGKYWLASRCVNLDTNYVDYFIRSINADVVGYQGLYATYSPYDFTAACAVRPVVVLESNVRLNKSDAAKDGTSAGKAWVLTY